MMKNISLQRVMVYGGMVAFWLVMILWSTGAFAQTAWTNCGNGYQTRVVSGLRQYRVVMTTGYSPLMLTDSLAKKLNLADSVVKYVTPTQLNAAIAGATIPDATTTVKGKIKLAGDLSGTADLPTVPGLADKIPLTQKGEINGVATLGADGKVPNSQIPALAISETFVVNSQAAMLAIVGADQGDVAVRTDISQSFILTQAPASTLSNWQELLAPTDAVSSVNGQVGNVNLTTTNIPEGTNLYYTDARVNANANLLHTTGNETKNGNLTINGEFLQFRTGKQVVIDAGEVVTNDLTILGSAVLKGTGSVSLGVTTPHNGDISPPSGGFTTARTQRMQDASGDIALTSNFATGQTIGANTTGNAATATNSAQWNGVQNETGTFGTDPAWLWGYDNPTAKVKPFSPTLIRSFLGSPSGGENLKSVTDRGYNSETGITVGSAGNATGTFSYGANSVSVGSSTNDQLILITNGSTKATILPGGNFGIGTATPSAKLDVNGKIAWGSDTFAANMGQLYNDGSLGTVFGTKTGTANDFRLVTPGGSPIMYVPTGTQNVEFAGNVTATSAQIANTPVNPTDVVRKQELDLKAPLASPAFTGTPTAPTPSAATNNDRIATTQFVTTAIINRKKNIVSVTSGSTTVIQVASIYTFSSTASGCTLPSIASSAGWEVVFINRASGSITFNSNAGGNDIDQAGVLSSTMSLATGDSMTMVNNGVSWVVIK